MLKDHCSLSISRLLLQLGDSQESARDLLAMVDMTNQAVGDALSGILLVEAALRRREWGLSHWAGLYADLPSRQLKASRFVYYQGGCSSCRVMRQQASILPLD